MKNCSYCGAEYPDDAVVCTIDDTSLIETSLDTDGTETLSHGEKREPATETAVLESDVPPDGEAELCISCLFPNLPDSRWCKRCAAPMSSVVGILMPDAAQAVGVVVRRAVETPTNVLIVSGIWVLNLPGLVLNTLLILLILGGGVGGLRELALFISASVCGVICASMLYRATRNYFRMRFKRSDATVGGVAHGL